VQERTDLLGWQEQQAEQLRAKIRTRPGFSTLSADKGHNVLRYINSAISDTTPEAIAPALRELKDPFLMRLQVAEGEANRKLDEYLNSGSESMIVPMDLALENREIRSEAEVDALLEEIRERLVQQLRSGQRIRLL
jgi:hypothetical protein